MAQEDNARKNRELEAQISRDERELVAKIENDRFAAEATAKIKNAESTVGLNIKTREFESKV